MMKNFRAESARTLYRALLAASLMLLTACGAPSAPSTSGQLGAHPTATLPAKWNGVDPRTGMPTVTPPASLAPRPLPAFSDPRVAYISPDSLLHVVSLDGGTNLAGTPIPLAGFPADGIWAAGTSPDGRQLAYYEYSQVTTVDATSGIRGSTDMVGVGDSEISWSPGQHYIALRGSGAVVCDNLATRTAFYTPQDTAALAK